MYGYYFPNEEIFADDDVTETYTDSLETEASYTETDTETETEITQIPAESLPVDDLSESDTESSDEEIDVYESIISNQEEIIVQLQELNSQISETNTVLVNFFFLFMFLMVCKFVHFLFYKVFFGGIT